MILISKSFQENKQDLIGTAGEETMNLLATFFNGLLFMDSQAMASSKVIHAYTSTVEIVGAIIRPTKCDVS